MKPNLLDNVRGPIFGMRVICAPCLKALKSGLGELWELGE